MRNFRAFFEAMTQLRQTWNLSKNLHRRIFRLTILHRQFHLISTVLVGKNTKNEWKWRNLHRWQKIYTAAGSDGMDKSHLWQPTFYSGSRYYQGVLCTWYLAMWIVISYVSSVLPQCNVCHHHQELQKLLHICIVVRPSVEQLSKEESY